MKQMARKPKSYFKTGLDQFLDGLLVVLTLIGFTIFLWLLLGGI